MKKYKVNIRGIEHSMQLSAADAKRLQAVEVNPVVKARATAGAETKKAAPANKSATPVNK